MGVLCTPSGCFLPAAAGACRPQTGTLAAGAGADLVTVATDTVRTAGIEPSGVLFAAAAADVRTVVVAGREVVRDGAHVLIERPETVLAKEIEALWQF